MSAEPHLADKRFRRSQTAATADRVGADEFLPGTATPVSGSPSQHAQDSTRRKPTFLSRILENAGRDRKTLSASAVN